MGKKKKKNKGFKEQLDRIKEALAETDVDSDEYDALLEKAESIANLIDMESRDGSINKIETAKIMLQGGMFLAALYADLRGHIVLRNPLHRLVPNRGPEMRRREVFKTRKK